MKLTVSLNSGLAGEEGSAEELEEMASACLLRSAAICGLAGEPEELRQPVFVYHARGNCQSW